MPHDISDSEHWWVKREMRRKAEVWEFRAYLWAAIAALGWFTACVVVMRCWSHG